MNTGTGALQFIPTEHTHVVFIKGVQTVTAPLYYAALSQAFDESQAILSAHPNSTCHIFQLRTVLKSKIQVDREDFNSK